LIQYNHILDNELDIGFEFNNLTGAIHIKSGSGTSATTSSMGDGSIGIGYSYTIDNSDPYEHLASVHFTAVAAVGGTMTFSSSGGVAVEGGISDSTKLSGELTMEYSESSSGGAKAVDLDKQFHFKLRSVED
jgi:hypothetical protein